jgi:hypothetical protein
MYGSATIMAKRGIVPAGIVEKEILIPVTLLIPLLAGLSEHQAM